MRQIAMMDGQGRSVTKREKKRRRKERRAAERDVKAKRVKVADGAPCPKCGRPMGRFNHAEDWEPRPQQPYFFRYWDKCVPCGHMQMYEAAKVYPLDEDSDLSAV